MTYDEMLELSASGARVLQLRSVEFARNHAVALHVRSSFSDGEGTWVTAEESERMLEKAMISGIAHTLDETVYRVERRPARDALHSAGRRARERRHDRPDRASRSCSRVRTRTAPRRRTRSTSSAASWSARRGAREGQRRRGGNEEPPRRRGDRRSPPSRRTGSSPRHRDDVTDQDHVLRPAGRRRARRPRAARRLRPRGRRDRAVAAPRIAVVGATGAVGRVTLELLREREYADVTAFASARSAGTTIDGLAVEEATPERLASGDFDVCLFSVGTERQPRARPGDGRRRRALRRQVRRVPARERHRRSSSPR